MLLFHSGRLEHRLGLADPEAILRSGGCVIPIHIRGISSRSGLHED